jgi:exodeoxyribonuclease VII small subunit
MPSKVEKPEPFEKILDKIEAVVRDLERSELPLDEALARFEEGVKLSREGSQRLEEAERRIEEILENGTVKELEESE